MSFSLKEFVKGIVLRGVDSDITDNIEGSIFYNKTEKKLKAFIDNSVQEVLTSSSGGGGGGSVIEEKVNLDLSNIIDTSIPIGVNLTSQNTSDSFFIRTRIPSSGNSARSLLTSGQINSGSGNTGQVTLYSAYNFGTGNTGAVDVGSGNAVSSGTSGSTNIVTGKSGTAQSGPIFIVSGSIDNFQQGLNNETNTSATGAIQINTGIIRNVSNPNRTGAVFLGSGSSTSIAGTGSVTVQSGRIVAGGSGTSGQLLLQSGNATESPNASSGDVALVSGNSAGTGNSGNIFIQTGSVVSGTRGDIVFDARRMYSTGGTSLLLSTLNVIIGTTDIDLLNSSGTVYHKNLTSDTDFQFLNGVPGKRFTVVIKNITASSYLANFPAVKQKAGTMVNVVNANTATIFEFVNSNNEYYFISCITDIV
jgi:hypothetical protein